MKYLFLIFLGFAVAGCGKGVFYPYYFFEINEHRLLGDPDKAIIDISFGASDDMDVFLEYDIHEDASEDVIYEGVEYVRYDKVVDGSLKKITVRKPSHRSTGIYVHNAQNQCIKTETGKEKYQFAKDAPICEKETHRL